MRIQKRSRGAGLLIFSSAVLFSPVISRAAIFASVDLEQVISYTVPGQSSAQYAPVSNSNVPFNTTAALTTGNGSSINATYSLYDNGATAGLSINTSAAVAIIPATGLSETTQNGFYSSNKLTTFSFAEPVEFSLVVSGNGSVVSGADAASGEVFFANSFYIIPNGAAG